MFMPCLERGLSLTVRNQVDQQIALALGGA